MAAYNWLRARVRCYRCGVEVEQVLQVHIGWCRYDEYSIGDRIRWMSTAEREEAKEKVHASGFPELRTLVEVGSETLRDFAISAGDFRCPQCAAGGTVLVLVEDNIFRSVLSTPKAVPYATIVLPGALEQVASPLPEEGSSDLQEE